MSFRVCPQKLEVQRKCFKQATHASLPIGLILLTFQPCTSFCARTFRSALIAARTASRLIVLEQQKAAMINSLPRCGEGRDSWMMCFGGYPNQQLQNQRVVRVANDTVDRDPRQCQRHAGDEARHELIVRGLIICSCGKIPCRGRVCSVIFRGLFLPDDS